MDQVNGHDLYNFLVDVRNTFGKFQKNFLQYVVCN